MITDSCDVIVIGAGPVGATAALLLASYGLRCIVVEARHEPQDRGAAHVLSTRSMEIWREIGVERDIRSLSAPLHDVRYIPYCTTLAGPELGRAPLAALLDNQMDAIDSISPTRTAHLPQSVLEPLLWLNLRDNARIDLRTGWKYLSHTDFSDAVGVSIADAATGDEEVILADYVIAADGSDSTVRGALRVEMEGPVLQHMVSVQFTADIAAYLHHRRGPVVWTHTAKGPGAFIVHRAPHDLVFQIPYFPPFESLDDFPAASCCDRILDAIGNTDVDIDIKSIKSWAMHAQVATNYRMGRVFLAGDAAHRFPPTDGLGLNTGVAEVHNLAWKLAWVISGHAGETLLDTYAQERRPVAITAASDAVRNIEAMFEVIAALGLPRRVVHLLPQIIAAIPTWVPRRPVRVVIRMLTTLAYQRLHLAQSAGVIGRRTRQRAAAAIARQGSHYRSWGCDLGVQYRGGAVVSDGLPPTHDGPGFYTPCVRAGGRLPHSWVEDHGHRVSTLDLVGHNRLNRLTLLTSADSHTVWSAAAEGLSISVASLADPKSNLFHTGGAGADPNAVVVRPDGHIVATLHSDRHAAASLRQALRVVSARSPGSHNGANL